MSIQDAFQNSQDTKLSILLNPKATQKDIEEYELKRIKADIISKHKQNYEKELQEILH